MLILKEMIKTNLPNLIEELLNLVSTWNEATIYYRDFAVFIMKKCHDEYSKSIYFKDGVVPILNWLQTNGNLDVSECPFLINTGTDDDLLGKIQLISFLIVFRVKQRIYGYFNCRFWF